MAGNGCGRFFNSLMKDNSAEIFPIVDEHGNTVGSATRGECHSGSMLLHPVVHLHLFNSRGELYLQRRPDWKDIQPGKWDTATGGHVNYGESVAEALKREVSEELGLSGLEFRYIKSYVFESNVEREYVNVFTAVSDIEPSPSNELNGGSFWKKDDIEAAIGSGVLTPNFESEYINVVRHTTNE